MPLPKPPAKRAVLLSRADFESQAAPARQARRRAAPAGEPVAPALLELSNEGTLPAAPPVAAEAPLPPASAARRASRRRAAAERGAGSRAATARRRCSCSTPTC